MPVINTLNVFTLGLSLLGTLVILVLGVLLVRGKYIEMQRQMRQDAEESLDAMRKQMQDLRQEIADRRAGDKLREIRALKGEFEIERLKKRSEFDRTENEHLEQLLDLALEIIEPLANGSKERLKQKKVELMQFRVDRRRELRKWEEDQDAMRAYLGGPTDGC